jgi:hypothetical protein
MRPDGILALQTKLNELAEVGRYLEGVIVGKGEQVNGAANAAKALKL